MSHVQGECGSSVQAKQKRVPQLHSGSQCGSPSTRTALPQCGTLRARPCILLTLHAASAMLHALERWHIHHVSMGQVALLVRLIVLGLVLANCCSKSNSQGPCGIHETAPAPVNPGTAGLVGHTCLQQSMHAHTQGKPAGAHLGHQRVIALSSTYDSSRLRSYFASSPASPASSRRTCRASRSAVRRPGFNP